MGERVGEAFELGEKLTVVGARLEPGAIAPDFALDHLVLETGALETVRLSDSQGRVRLLNIVNSLDTPVCQVETRRWDMAARSLGGVVVLFTISMDLPFAQARWCGAERTSHMALSAHRDEAFGQGYGVLIKEWRLLQRAVIVVGPDDRVVHAEYVADQMAEPDYDAALEAVRQSLSR
ncbi:MAG TPA: thiol peroxidase [Candidatus Dormibacteraeota bacterium]|nr:thiol peroxidase [Candidatus Dormibacteraeota bacterium]